MKEIPEKEKIKLLNAYFKTLIDGLRAAERTKPANIKDVYERFIESLTSGEIPIVFKKGKTVLAVKGGTVTRGETFTTFQKIGNMFKKKIVIEMPEESMFVKVGNKWKLNPGAVATLTHELGHTFEEFIPKYMHRPGVGYRELFADQFLVSMAPKLKLPQEIIEKHIAGRVGLFANRAEYLEALRRAGLRRAPRRKKVAPKKPLLLQKKKRRV